MLRVHRLPATWTFRIYFALVRWSVLFCELLLLSYTKFCINNPPIDVARSWCNLSRKRPMLAIGVVPGLDHG